MKLIVVPTDFSPLADNALKYGMDLATTMGSSLMIVHVYQIPISYSEVPLITISIDEIKKASEEQLANAQPAEDLLTMDGMNDALANTLAGKGIITMEDLAEQAVDDLMDIDDMDEEKAAALIMTARAPWFAEEQGE